MATVFCHMCGTQLQDTAKFCNHCGTPVVHPEPAPAPAPVPEEVPVAVAPVVTPVPAPVVEEAPVFTPEPAPVVEEAPVFTPEPAPVVEEAPVFTPAPAPVVEEAPVFTPAPAPVVEEAPVFTPAPAPVVEEAPVFTPAPAPVVEEAPVFTPAPAPVAEEAPVVEEPPVFTYIPPTYEPPSYPEAAPLTAEPEPAPVAVEAPVAPVPAEPVPQPEAPKKKELYKKRGVGRTFGAAFICLFLFIFALASVLAYDVTQIFSGDFLSNTISNVVEDVKLTEMPAKDLIPSVEDEDMSVIEWAINEVADSSDGTVTVTEESVEEFMKDSNLDDFLNEKLQAYIDVYTGKSDADTVISKEEIQELLEEQIPQAEKAFGVVIDADAVETFVEDIEEEGLLEKLEPKAIAKEVGLDTGLLRTVAKWSNVIFIACVVITGLLALWLFGNNRWNILRTLGDYGILATILGVIVTAVAVIGAFFEDLWIGFLPKSMSSLSPAIAGFLETTLMPSLIILGAGILLIVIFVVGKKIIVKSANKQINK